MLLVEVCKLCQSTSVCAISLGSRLVNYLRHVTLLILPVFDRENVVENGIDGRRKVVETSSNVEKLFVDL